MCLSPALVYEIAEQCGRNIPILFDCWLSFLPRAAVTPHDHFLYALVLSNHPSYSFDDSGGVVNQHKNEVI